MEFVELSVPLISMASILQMLMLILGERSEPHMGDTSGIFHILLGRAQRSPTWTIHLGFSIYVYIIDVRRTALILRCGAVRVDLLRMLIVV